MENFLSTSAETRIFKEIPPALLREEIRREIQKLGTGLARYRASRNKM